MDKTSVVKGPVWYLFLETSAKQCVESSKPDSNPMVQCPGDGDSVRLDGNPLGVAAHEKQITSLRDRRVKVEF